MNEAEIRKGWLTGNAVIAFVGALFIGQVWETWETSERTGSLVIFLLMAGLFFSSLFLALATIVRPLQRCAISIADWWSPILALFVMVAFLASLASGSAELPPDQWWSQFLIVGGLLLFLFLMFSTFRTYRQFAMAKSTDAKSNTADSLVYGQRDIGGWSVPTLKLSRADRTLEVRVQGEIVNATNKSERLDPWRRKVMSAVQAARGGKPWNSDSECAVSVGLRFHPDSHGGDSFDVDNFTKPIFDAVAGGLFSDDAPEAVGYWHFPDSNFKTLLIHRLPNADDASEEGAAIFVSSWRKKPSLKERGQALLRALKKKGQALFRTLIEGGQALFRTLIEGGQALFRALLNRVRR